jgi:hypothetical protein
MTRKHEDPVELLVSDVIRTRSTHAIRPDLHARFVALVARADSRVADERRALQRRLETALARETREAHQTEDERGGGSTS